MIEQAVKHTVASSFSEARGLFASLDLDAVLDERRQLGKVKPLIRFIKAWKYYKNVQMYSFYLEMKVARYAATEKSILYSIDMKRIFNALLTEGLTAMQDPTGVSGYIYPCFSKTMKDDALSKIETALSRAEKAYEAEDKG